jgi:hypothetical protein
MFFHFPTLNEFDGDGFAVHLVSLPCKFKIKFMDSKNAFFTLEGSFQKCSIGVARKCHTFTECNVSYSHGTY